MYVVNHANVHPLWCVMSQQNKEKILLLLFVNTVKLQIDRRLYTDNNLTIKSNIMIM